MSFSHFSFIFVMAKLTICIIRVNMFARERGTHVFKALHAGIVWIRRYPERGWVSQL